MTGHDASTRIVSASREIEASAERIFELIADPANQPLWDGNENLSEAAPGQRVRVAGQIFIMRLTKGGVRENHVVDFTEGRRIAWRPAEPGKAPPGHLWAWELEPLGPSRTVVTHTYDWTELADPKRLPRARATTAERLRASLDRLAALAERIGQSTEPSAASIGEGGDPACWVHLVCPDCGAVVSDGHRENCDYRGETDRS